MKKTALCIWLCSLLCCGCSLRLPAGGGAAWENGKASRFAQELAQAAERISDGTALTGEEEEPDGEPAQEEAWEEIQEPVSASVVPLEENRYAYGLLDEREKALYREILDALERMETDVEVSADDEKELDHIFTYVMIDHPEIFYVDGVEYVKHMMGEEMKAISFSGSYIYTPEEVEERRDAIGKKTEQILAGMPEGCSEYEKVRFVYEYLIKNTDYVQQAPDNQNICSVFLNGESVCQGYAKATQYLLQKAGVFATMVTGKVGKGENHAWNLVRVDGEYYYVDTTWGDASYVVSGHAGDYDGRQPDINYEYLCVPDEQLFKTHRLDGIMEVPVCDSMKANYYVREGAYFTEPDLDRVGTLFAKAYKTGTEYVTLKCADEEVYQELRRKLIEEQQVFSFLQGKKGSVAYAETREQLALSFWLQD